MKKLIILFFTILSFGGYSQVNLTQLDELPATAKYYLFRDLMNVSADLFPQDSATNLSPISYLAENISKQNALDFFPYIADFVVANHKDNTELIKSLDSNKLESFRSIIIKNSSPDQIIELTEVFLKYTATSANEVNQPEMASLFYSEGKVYVVVAVLVCILFGIAFYLFLLNRKINQIKE